MNCDRCGQELSNAESIARRMGPVCALKSAAAISGGLRTLGTTEAELDTLESRSASLIIKALESNHRNSIRDAAHFLLTARTRRDAAKSTAIAA